MSSKLRKLTHWIAEHTLGHLVTLPIVGVILLLLEYALTTFGERQLLPYLLSHPIRSSISILGASLLLILMYRATGFAKAYIRNRELLAAAGLSGFSRHCTDLEKDQDWTICNQHLKTNPSNDIRILGLSGWETFGSPKSPLHELLKESSGEIKILLIDPDSDAFKKRATSLGKNNLRRLKADIAKSLEFCEELKKQGKSIWVKQYTQTPIWKMIFTNHYLWLQYYAPGIHVNDTPVYTFFANTDKTSLFYPLTNVFKKRWDVDGNRTVISPA